MTTARSPKGGAPYFFPETTSRQIKKPNEHNSFGFKFLELGKGLEPSNHLITNQVLYH